MYIDVSKLEDREGCVEDFPHTSLRGSFIPFASIYTVELYAICPVLQCILYLSDPSFTFLSDSRNGFAILGLLYFPHPQVLQIYSDL